MTLPTGLFRWTLTVVYATAMLGALIVPHGHGFLGGCGCSEDAGTCTASAEGECCHSHGSHDQAHDGHEHHGHSHKGHTHHGHSTCHHTHNEAGAPVSQEDSERLPTHDDCPYCRFLAQPVQLAAAPILISTGELLSKLPDSAVVLGVPTALATPPARGPPAC